jgi:glycosyltransferase involved in cell wall biosynthesis
VHIVVLNWRDTANPEGGGSEVYIEHLARRWASRGHRVSMVCAAHGSAASLDVQGDLRVIRVGSKLTVYSRARRLLRRGDLGHIDVIVDVQNGIPFFATWASTAPTVVLVHHVHREQWPVVYDPVRARVGWWIESVLSPWAHRGNRYVAVSEATRAELISQGVDAESIAVVHNGTEPLVHTTATQDPHPRVLVLGRLVPHKRVEHVIRAAARIRVRHPGLTIAVVGDGWWASQLQAAADSLGVSDIVEFTGHVDEAEKARQVARAWVLALPSLKEGWGLVVMEAASRGVPTIAYADAGGVAESIRDGETGILVDGDEQAFAQALDTMLTNRQLREAFGAEALTWSAGFSWDASAEAFERVLHDAVAQPGGHAHQSGTSWWSRRRRTADRP